MTQTNATAFRQNGFSLIEGMVSLLVLVLTLLGLSSLMTTNISTNREARRVTAATTLAQDKLEEIRGLAYTAIASGSDGPLSESGATTGTGPFFNRSWVVANDTPVAGSKTVLVNASWINENASTRTVQLPTIISE